MLKLALFVLIFGVFLKQAYPLTKVELWPKDAPFVCFKEGNYGRSKLGKPYIPKFCQSFKNLRKDVKRCTVVVDVKLYESNPYATHITDSCVDEDHMHTEEKNASRNDCLIAEMEDPFYNEPKYTDGTNANVSNAILYCETKHMGKILWDCFNVADNTGRKNENYQRDMVDSISEAAETYYRINCETPVDTGTPPTDEATVNEVFLWTSLFGVLCVILS